MAVEQALKNLILAEYKSVRAFSESVGLPYSTIDSIFKRGISNSSVANVLKICRALDIEADALEEGRIERKISPVIDAAALVVGAAYLMGWDDSSDVFSLPGILPPPRTVKKPRLGSIACGEPIMCVQNYDGEDDVPGDIHCDFTLVCHGDSMTGARIMDGDIVYIRQQDDVENREIAAVLIDEERVTLKRVRKNEQGRIVMLMAENPAYDPIDLRDVQSVRVLGKAVGFTSIIN
ncbi:MAG: S24 family peptidase [Clostridia bacterium]